MWCWAAEPCVLTTAPVLSFFFACLPIQTSSLNLHHLWAMLVLAGAADPPSGDMLGADPLTASWLRTHERHNPDTHQRLAYNMVL